MRSLYGWIVGSVALVGVGHVHAQVVVGPVDPGPTVFDLIDDFGDSVAADEANASLLTGLAHAYLQTMQGFEPSAAQATIAKVYLDTYGQRFTMGTNGFEAWGSGGPLDADSYTKVQSVPYGLTVPLQDLELWPLDLTQPGVPPVQYPTGWTKPVEAYLYAATFGKSKPHVGLALRFQPSNLSQLIFVPMVEVPDGGLISASDAAAFLGMLAVNGFDSTSFSDWAIAQYALPSTLGGETHAAPQPEVLAECDMAETMECIMEFYDHSQADMAEEAARHKARLKEIVKNYGSGAGVSLGVWCATGALVGAIEGSVDPNGGSAADAALGALTGAFGGATTWIANLSNNAAHGDQLIAEEDARHKAKVCSIIQWFVFDVIFCVQSYCPEMSAEAAQEATNMKIHLGCQPL